MANVTFNEESTKSGTIRSSSDFGIVSKSERIFRKATSYIDETLIPILGETNRLIENINLLKNFTTAVTYLQFFFGGYLLLIPGTIGPGWLKKISQILFIFSYDIEEGPLQYLFIIIDLVTIFSTMFISIDFTINHKFRKWSLYLIRIWHGHLFNIVLIPNIVMVFYSFRLYGEHDTTGNAVLCVIDVCCVMYVFIHTSYILTILEQNPFLSHQTIHLWRPHKLYDNIIFNGFLFGICTMADFFGDRWPHLIPAILTLIIGLTRLQMLGVLPFESVYFNAFHHSYSFFSLTACIVWIVFDQLKLTSNVIYFVAPISVSALSFIILSAMYRKKTRQIFMTLNTKGENGNPLLAEEKSALYDSLNLSVNDAFYYLQVGLQYRCRLFLDWSLPQYIQTKYIYDEELLIFITWETAFFPSESHLFHCYITMGLKMQNPSYYIRAFFFQLHRVHIFRQSSASTESARDLVSIQTKSQVCIDLISFFWEAAGKNQQNVTPNVVHHIYQNVTEADAQWAEMLDKYPNNALFIREFSKYLLDAKSTFQNAIIWHQKCTCLENGTKLHNDKMFRCFLKKYPVYLKKGVVDTKGNIVNKKTSKKNSSMDTSDMNPNTSTDENSDSFDMEEAITFLPSLKLRLALERSINQMKSPILTKTYYASFFRLLLIIVYVMVIYFVLTNLFFPRKLLSSHLQYYNQFSHNILLLTHEFMWYYFLAFPEISNTSKMIDLYQRVLGDSSLTKEYYFNMSKQVSEISCDLSRDSLLYLDSFAKNLYLNNEKADDLIHMFSNLISSEKMDQTKCYKIKKVVFQKVEENETTFDFFLRSYITLLIKEVSDFPYKRQTYGKSDNYCESYVQCSNIQEMFTSTIGFLSKTIGSKFDNDLPSKVSNDITETTIFLTCFTPFVVFLLLLPNVIYTSSGIEAEKDQFTQMMLTVDREDAAEAAQVLFKQNVNIPENKKSRRITSFDFKEEFVNTNILIDVVIYILLCVLVMMNSVFTLNTDSIIDSLNEHLEMTFLQRNVVIEMGRDATYLVFINQMETDHFLTLSPVDDELPQDQWVMEAGEAKSISFMNTSYVYNMLMKDIELFNNITKLMEEGSPLVLPLVGYNKKIDEFKQKSKCETKMSDSVVDYASCISFDRMISFFSSQVDHIKNAYKKIKIWDECPVEVANLIESRVAVDYEYLIGLYCGMINSQLDSYSLILIVLLTVEMLLAICIFFFEYIMMQSSNKEFEVFKSLVLRINPVSVAANPNLIGWIYGSSSNDSKITTPAHAIFQTSHDAMILMSLDNVIESLNPATTNIFGYTPEQMLGQNIRLLLSADMNTQFYYIMGLMSSGQAALTYETTAVGAKDDNTKVPLKLSLIGFSSTGEKRADSFALLLKDMTEEEEQKEAVEKAKKQAELILLQILPKDIIMRLNRGDKNISFTVKSATIIFIDIEKFSIYASSLSANDIMKNLSRIFTSFDRICASFNLITKIKLIGDIYMAAAGLFSPDILPEKHADQILQFALQALDAIEELNIQLNANLQIRIGVNTDGPLIAGVLGTEKPLFDIIGDPINVAARLQSTDIAGLVQISEGTYKYVAALPYHIEQRGEVELKGKGKRMTYLVHPNENTEGVKLGNFVVDEEDLTNSSMNLSKMVSSSSLLASKISMNSSKQSYSSNMSFRETKTSLHCIVNNSILGV